MGSLINRFSDSVVTTWSQIPENLLNLMEWLLLRAVPERGMPSRRMGLAAVAIRHSTALILHAAKNCHRTLILPVGNKRCLCRELKAVRAGWP